MRGFEWRLLFILTIPVHFVFEGSTAARRDDCVNLNHPLGIPLILPTPNWSLMPARIFYIDLQSRDLIQKRQPASGLPSRLVDCWLEMETDLGCERSRSHVMRAAERGKEVVKRILVG